MTFEERLERTSRLQDMLQSIAILAVRAQSEDVESLDEILDDIRIDLRKAAALNNSLRTVWE